jgi:hypothetical protein
LLLLSLAPSVVPDLTIVGHSRVFVAEISA